MGCHSDGGDVVDEGCLLSAAPARRIDGEEGFAFPFPFGVVATLASAGALLVEPGLTFALHALHGLARLALGVSAVAVRANGWSANRHGQATGAMAGVPLMTTAPAAIEVPPFFVTTTRMKRLDPM